MNRDEIRQHNRARMPSLAAELDGTLGDLMREFNASLQYAVSDGHEVGTQTEPYDVARDTSGIVTSRSRERVVGPVARRVE